MNVSIRVSHISKRYALYKSAEDRLKQSLFWRFGKNYANEFLALEDVTFDVEKGEMFGIIGRNGSGKSTLLQIIAGTLRPTSGMVECKGKVAALLELGSGFNPEFSGRENVYLNAAILGLKKSEIDKLFPDIEAFAEIGQFIDQPLKTYSSGMMVRLAFAVQAFVVPDVFIIDEALSVGDIFFAQKCFSVIEGLKRRGTTVLFVSHDIATVRNLCSRALYLKNGKTQAIGDVRDVVQSYYQEGIASPLLSTKGLNLSEENAISKRPIADFEAFKKRRVGHFEDNNVTFHSVCISNANGESTLSFDIGEQAIFAILVQSKQAIGCQHFTLTMRNRQGQIVFCGGTYNLKVKALSMSRDRVYLIEMRLDLQLEAGYYTMTFSLGSVFENVKNRGIVFSEFTIPEPLHIKWDYEDRIPRFFGMCGLSYEIVSNEFKD